MLVYVENKKEVLYALIWKYCHFRFRNIAILIHGNKRFSKVQFESLLQRYSEIRTLENSGFIITTNV